MLHNTRDNDTWHHFINVKLSVAISIVGMNVVAPIETMFFTSAASRLSTA
jgi:hypothetical protein